MIGWNLNIFLLHWGGTQIRASAGLLGIVQHATEEGSADYEPSGKNKILFLLDPLLGRERLFIGTLGL